MLQRIRPLATKVFRFGLKHWKFVASVLSIPFWSVIESLLASNPHITVCLILAALWRVSETASRIGTNQQHRQKRDFKPQQVWWKRFCQIRFARIDQNFFLLSLSHASGVESKSMSDFSDNLLPQEEVKLFKSDPLRSLSFPRFSKKIKKNIFSKNVRFSCCKHCCCVSCCLYRKKGVTSSFSVRLKANL